MINRWLGDVGHKIWWYSEEKHRGGMLPGETGGLDVKEMQGLLTVRLHQRAIQPVLLRSTGSCGREALREAFPLPDSVSREH